MKKILLIGMFVIGGLSYGIDYNGYEENKELMVVESVESEDSRVVSKVSEKAEDSMKAYVDNFRIEFKETSETKKMMLIGLIVICGLLYGRGYQLDEGRS